MLENNDYIINSRNKKYQNMEEKMTVKITARQVDLSENLKEYVESEIGRLSNIYDKIINTHVIMDKEAHSQVSAEIIINVPHKQLVVKEISADLTKAIDEAVEKMLRQIKKYKEKLRQ